MATLSKPNNLVESIIIYAVLFAISFMYCFGIGTFNDIDMQRYFVNAFYMTNYGLEGVKDYPNQLFSLFLYWCYKITGNWYGLTNVLFFPLYIFGVYSTYLVLNYFLKHNYLSLLFVLILFLLVDRYNWSARNFSSYIVYFFFFISIIYLCLYHPKKIYLIAFYFALGTLFRNQVIIFLPFLPFVINPKINKTGYLKTITPLIIGLIVVQLGFETIKDVFVPQKSAGVSFKFYFKELDTFLLKSSLFTSEGIILFLKNNLSHFYFYLMLIPCFFMFNKKFTSKIKNPHKPLLTIFLILALFIYFMPAIMYIRLGLNGHGAIYYGILSRYSFIMIVLLIPIYHFILKEQTFVKLKPSMVYMVMIFVLLPNLRPHKAHFFAVNTIKNGSHKKEIYDIDSAKIKTVLKNNFKENAFILSNNWLSKIYVDPKASFSYDYRIKENNFTQTKYKNNPPDGLIIVGKSYPYFTADKTTYKKIYEENTDKYISIYKKYP